MYEADLERLRQMKDRIDQIDRLAQDLQSLGEGVPAVEKNSRNILSAVYALKFGISDIVDIHDAESARE